MGKWQAQKWDAEEMLESGFTMLVAGPTISGAGTIIAPFGGQF